MAGFYSLLKSLKSEVVLALSHVPRVIKTTPLPFPNLTHNRHFPSTLNCSSAFG
jgi:hypothetical protein